MKNKILFLGLALAGLGLGGCYTVLKGPRTAADLADEKVAVADERRDRLAEPRVGRFRDQDRDAWDDFYRYPGGPGGYSDFGYPIYGVGYSSGYGMFGYGGYPGYGYGPYSYGYDPYYSGYSGTGALYVPPGYELVSTRELEEMRAAQRNLAGQSQSPAIDEQLLQKQRKEQEEVWAKRVDPRVRQAPTPTSRTTGVAAPVSAPSPASTTYGAPPPAPKSTGAKASGTPTKSRR
jgi:hypothetical protein